jgi:hypothetical protein
MKLDRHSRLEEKPRGMTNTYYKGIHYNTIMVIYSYPYNFSKQ